MVLDGKQIYKKLYKPTNPRTPKQQMHRAKLAFVNRLSKALAEAVMHVYAWFQATAYHRAGNGKITVRPGQASPSVYLGGFQA